jgi:RNA polymerase sigma-70 factor (ECF subfamily)
VDGLGRPPPAARALRRGLNRGAEEQKLRLPVKIHAPAPSESVEEAMPALEEQAFDAYRTHPGPDRLVALLRTQQDRVYNLCFQVLRHAQDAEDAAQKVLLKLVDGIDHLPDAPALRRWLYRVCITTALDARTERSRRRVREREVAIVNKTVTGPEPEGEGELLGAIGSLDSDLGDLILRHYFEKSTLKELAAERQISEVAVWKRIEKGKERLRELLSTPTSALSMAALELRLGSIVPVSAPVGWVVSVLAAKAGGGAALGGLAMAAKSGLTAKIAAVCIAVLAVGVGAGLYLGTARVRPEPISKPEVATRASGQNRPQEAPSVPKLPSIPVASAPASVSNGSPAAVAPPVPAGGLSDDELREKMRKVIRLTIKAKGKSLEAVSDPEETKVILEFIKEFGAKLQAPSADSAFFTRVTRLSLELMFEELGIPISEDQKSSLASALGRMGAQLEQGRGACAQDRPLGELRAYRELTSGLKALTDAQLSKMAEVATPSSMFPLGDSRTVFLNMVQDPAEEVLREWTAKYNLVDSQKTAAAGAARTFIEAWDQVDRRFEAQYGHRPGDQPAGSSLNNFLDQTAAVVDYALATLEAQRDSLRLLEGALTPEQLDKLRGAAMSQFKRATVIRQTAGADH